VKLIVHTYGVSQFSDTKQFLHIKLSQCLRITNSSLDMSTVTHLVCGLPAARTRRRISDT